MLSSPPKYDDNRSLPTMSRTFDSSPSVMFQDNDGSFLNASDIGDDSFAFDDSFDLPQSSLVLPPIMPAVGRRAGLLATELPSISEASTPRSIREEYFVVQGAARDNVIG